MSGENKDLRFSFPLPDYYVAEKTGFKKRELLTKYDGDDKFDLIIIDDELQPHSLYDYINNGLNGKVGNNHIESSNQHIVATEKNNGFMSSKDKCNLEGCVDSLQNVNDLNNYIFNKGSMDILKDYTITEDGHLFVKVSVLYANSVRIDIDKDIELHDRPDNDYLYESILLCINNVDNKFPTMDIVYDIKTYDKPYNTSIPILGIYRRNKNIISATNPYGRKDNSIISMEEIYEPCEEIKQKELKTIRTNLKRNISSALLYIPFNGEDIDNMSNLSLNKYCIYKTSPFGKMLSKSINEGDYIQINNRTSKFLLEFLLDTTSLYLNDETIITLRDDMLSDSILIKSINNNDLLITIGEDNFIINIDTSIQYQFVNIQFDDNRLSIYINGELKKKSSFNKTYSNIRYIQVNSLNVSIGEVLISTQLNHIESCIDKNNMLVSNNGITNNNPVLNKVITSIGPLSISNEHCICKFNLASTSKIGKNDTVDIIFNEELSALYEDNFNIDEIYNNRLLVKGNNFTVEDDVVIYNGLNNLQKLYNITKVDGDYIYLENSLDMDKLGYSIEKVGNYVTLIATVNGERLSKVYHNNNGMSIMFDDEYPLDTEIKLEFVTITNSLSHVGNIINVTFDHLLADKTSNTILQLSKDKITINYNGSQIDPYKLSLGNLFISNDEIDLEVVVNMNDFLNITDVGLLNKVLDIKCHTELSSGSNQVTINNKTYNRGNILSGYYIDNLYIDDKGYIRFNITTKTDNKIGKILLNSLDISVSFKDGELFTLSDINNKLTDYLLINDDFMYTNSSSEISILYNE